MEKVHLQSDFSDYYDSELVGGINSISYIRKYSECFPKAKALAVLRRLGVPTIDIGPVRELVPIYSHLVVYTNPNKHSGEGKIIVSAEDAAAYYSNFLASPYYGESCGSTVKVIQVGARRFNLVLKNESALKSGKIVRLNELQPELNYMVRLPIFSIDYIDTQEGIKAVDFNQVQELQSLGFSAVMSATDVAHEIYKGLVQYN